jgi:hypothetical protein
LLGSVAVRTKKPLTWDGPAMKATNAPEADRFLKDQYRKGWEIWRFWDLIGGLLEQGQSV